MNLLIFNALSWEQRKLEDIVEFLDTLRKPLTENTRTKGPYPYYGASGVVDHVADYLFNEELILLSEDGANITDRNYPVCFLASGKYWVNNHAHVLRAKPKMDNNFICMSLERKDYSNYNTGMAMPKLNQDTCRRIPVDCPSYEEQKKIGDYFRSLDNLITLHQSKAESWKNKKSQLSTISWEQRKLGELGKARSGIGFPDAEQGGKEGVPFYKVSDMNNMKKPKIRFKGFTDDWEQRKLAELVTRYEDPVETPHDGYIRLGIRSHAKGTFHEYVEPGHELETAQMHRVAANKLIFNITFAWEHAVAITTEDDAGKLVSHRFPQFSLSELLRPEFLKYVILDEGFHHKLYLASPGGAGRNRVLKVDEALDYPIFFPSVEEQHKIGEFLNQLNDLITLHQSELEKLQKIKKSLLERMFV